MSRSPDRRPRVPPSRIRVVRAEELRSDREFVLYWMIAARRLEWNFALDRAIEIATGLGKPLVVLEALRCDYRWASRRLHRFVLDGMAENARRAAGAPLHYVPYVEPENGAGKGLLRSLSRRAAAIVTDDFPCFFLPRMVAAAAREVDCRLEAVDSNGLLPLSVTDAAAPTAYAFRRVLQRRLPEHLTSHPEARPLELLELPRLPGAEELLRGEEGRRWQPAADDLLAGADTSLAKLPIDAAVAPVALRGGSAAATTHWRRFLRGNLALYAERRNDPEDEVASGLSPYLHFGHLSVHQALAELAEQEGWSPEDVARTTSGAREGWWGMSKPAEAFLDQLVTWREVGYQFSHHREDYSEFDALPDWARATLSRHADDERPWLYSAAELESAATHDPIWNAAQRQLVGEGRIHNYLRMLWGKKVLEWSATPRDAVATLIHLNNRYALDGRNPNSYSGIFWCFGRFDRPWGPERAIFGTVRYMSSASTARKLSLKGYLSRWGGESVQASLL
ncbi:MAG: deoxyribodipyrimidine photolyase [Thermoanaerobaculia bacterium]